MNRYTRREPNKPTAYGYLRVSTEAQADSGNGLEVQRKKLLDYAQDKLKDYIWGGLYEDAAVSGSIPLRQREQGFQMDLKLGKGDVVLLTRLDRGFRSIPDLAVTMDAWFQRGINVHVIDQGIDSSSNMGKFFIYFLALLAQMERDFISSRTREALQNRIAKGLFAGAAPYGFKVKRTEVESYIVPDAKEREGGRLAVVLAKAGETYREIAEIIFEQGYTNRAGKKYSVMGAWNLVRKEMRLAAKEQSERQVTSEAITD